MDRPIAYDKLAREDRFVRMRAREVAQVKVEQGLPPFPGLLSRESIKERVHGIMVGEMQAMEGAGRTVYDFPDAPWEFTMDMARQVWDESRHVDIYIRLLEHLDGYIGEFPETTILWRCACAEDAAARVAGVNRGLEGLACDVFNQLVHIARKMGDPILERAVDFVLADEITHVRMGSKWLTKLTEAIRSGGACDRVSGDHRRALQLGRSAAGRGPRRGAHLHRPRGPGVGRVHGRGDRAADQDDAALAGLLMSAPVGASTRPDGDAVGPHPLQGFSSADESARLIRHYRYAVERMMRILGGWIALTPELSAKLLLGRHVWDSAQHADVLGKRLPELRAQAQMSEPPNAAFVAFMNAIEEPERPDQSVERLVGVYRVLKPHLIASYEEHLRRINSVYEPPTERILVRLIEEERRHVAAGSTILRHLSAAPGLAERGEAWRAQLEDLLVTASGLERIASPRIPGPAIHGTGCFLSSAIAALLALGRSLPSAVRAAILDLRELRTRADPGPGDGGLARLPLFPE